MRAAAENALCVFALGLALAACATEHNPAVAWLTPRSFGGQPTSDDPPPCEPLNEPDRRVEYPATYLHNLIRVLGDKEFVRLDRETFTSITGEAYPSAPDRVPYLVRGVALEEPLGMIHVNLCGTDLSVIYHGPIVAARAFRLPVIVLLPAAPTRVYVSVFQYF